MRGVFIHCILFLALFISSFQLFSQVTRGPYLQVGTSTSIVIRWRTTAAKSSKIWYGTSLTSLNQTVTDTTHLIDHEMTLSGLSPYTQYYYAIGDTAGIVAGGTEDFAFLTSPTTGSPQPFRAWILGDAGFINSNQRGVRDAYYGYIGDDHTDMVLLLGDNAYDDGTDAEFQYALFENMYEDMLRKSVMYSCTGNHEVDAYSNPNDAPYWDIFTFPTEAEAGGVASGTEYYYSVDYANVHFVILDSEVSGREVNDPMVVWLENDLASTQQDWVVVVFHQPPYSKGTFNSDWGSRAIGMREKIVPILESYGVDLFLCGHSHVYERSYLINGHYSFSATFDSVNMVLDGGDGKLDGDGAYTKSLDGPQDGAVYVVTGSAGSTVTNYGSLDHPAHYYSVAEMGSSVMEVDGNELTVKFIDKQGNIDDYFTMRKNDPNNDTAIVQIDAGNRDVEESRLTGTISMTSTDLEMAYDGATEQIIGLRFLNVGVPQGANISHAKIQFTADETDTDSTDLIIYGEAEDFPLGFEATDPFNVTNRDYTSASVSWKPTHWNTLGEAWAPQRTPDLTEIIQEIVDRAGYVSGNPMNFILEGSGVRVAESYEGAPTGSAVLSITYRSDNLADQSISFDSIPDKSATDAPFSLTASASSSLPVSFNLISGPATLSGNTVTLSGLAGEVVIRASQEGNGTYLPSADVERSFMVTCTDTDNDGICDGKDDCPGFEDDRYTSGLLQMEDNWGNLVINRIDYPVINYLTGSSLLSNLLGFAYESDSNYIALLNDGAGSAASYRLSLLPDSSISATLLEANMGFDRTPSRFRTLAKLDSNTYLFIYFYGEDVRTWTMDFDDVTGTFSSITQQQETSGLPKTTLALSQRDTTEYYLLIDDGEGTAALYEATLQPDYSFVITLIDSESGISRNTVDMAFLEGEPCPERSIALKAMLEGAYDTTTNLMTDTYRDNGLISISDPFGLGTTLNPDVLIPTNQDAVVDWLKIELRNATDSTIVFAEKAVLIQRDGDVIDSEGDSLLVFDELITNNYYVAIQHPNHLGVMSAAPIDLTSDPYFDFTSPSTLVYTKGGGPAMRNEGGVLLLWSGDSNGDGTVNAVDKNDYWRPENGGTFQYGINKADFNLDGVINAVDKNEYWRVNNSLVEQLP